jgi:cytochrome P450
VLTQEVYPNPETFDPERFLKDGSLDKSVRDPTTYIFGFGRRYIRCFVIATYRF